MSTSPTTIASTPIDLDLFRSELHYTGLIQNLPVAIYTCDKHGFIRFYNKAAVELWGREPVLGKELWCGSFKIYDTDGVELALERCPMAITLREERPVRGVEIVIERPDGKRLHVLPHPDPMFNETGDLIGAVNMLVDVTEHKQTRDANILLQHYNDELEQFAYAASHDMQEPLRKITTFTNLVMERSGESLDDHARNYLNKVRHSAERMNSIIRDLLDYSRATYSAEHFVETDLNVVVENVVTDLELLINNKKATIAFDELPVIKAIPSQMNRLFYNLIQNALKFSRQDEPPLIRITIDKSNDEGFVEIKFADNGIGFEPKYSEKIFKLFQRLNDRYSYNGNGIGLSLCKKIAEIHNGSISAHSTPDVGSVFCLKFPSTCVVTT